MNPLIFTLFPFAFSDSVTTKIDTKKLFLDIIHRQLFLLMLNFKSRVKNTVSIVTYDQYGQAPNPWSVAC